MHGEVLVLAEPDAVALEAVRRLASLVDQNPRGRFSVALSGGSTPQRLYRLMATPPWNERINWSGVHFFLADERHLPLDHADSNCRMIRETLFDPLHELGLSGMGHFHPMSTAEAVEACAQSYETVLREFFSGQPPCLDLVILGMGPDGHTASLFPGHEHPHGHWVLPVHASPKPPPERLTLSLDIINRARHVWFLATGADKSQALAELRGAKAPLLPANQVCPRGGQLLWLVDEAAWRAG